MNLLLIKYANLKEKYNKKAFYLHLYSTVSSHAYGNLSSRNRIEVVSIRIESECGSIRENWKARLLIYQNALVRGNGRHHTDDALYITPTAYDRNTSIMMRLEVKYLNIVPPKMICLILNYLFIAPPTRKCSTSTIQFFGMTYPIG